MDSFTQHNDFNEYEPESSETSFSVPGSRAGDPSKDNKRAKTTQFVNTVVPLLAAQLPLCEVVDGAAVSYRGRRLHEVTVVGRVRDVTVEASALVFALEDPTGTCLARLWTTPKEQEDSVFGQTEDTTAWDNVESTAPGTLVRLCGTLIVVDDTVGFNVLAVRPLLDANELSFHLLQAMHAELFFRGAVSASFAEPVSKAVSTEDSGLDDISKKILAAIAVCAKNDKEYDGMTKQEIASRLQGVSAADLDSKLEFLLEEGHLYNTLDANTYLTINDDY